MSKKWLRRRQRLFGIVEVGNDVDLPSRLYDYINVISIVLNLTASILYTFADIRRSQSGGRWDSM